MAKIRWQNNIVLGVRCLVCGEPMIVKTNTITDEQFLGCRNYPYCKETQEIPYEYIARKLGQKSLFD